jgi:hypothetical protein
MNFNFYNNLKYSVFKIYNLIINFYFKINIIYYTYSYNLKCKYFNNKFINISLYDYHNKKYITLYNYDKPFKLLYAIIFNHQLIDINYNNIFTNDFIYVYTYIKNYKIYKVLSKTFIKSEILDKYNDLSINNFIYCILDDKYDVTHYFNDFKSSALLNNEILTEDFIYVLSKYYNENKFKYSQLKIMMDYDYNEYIYKEKDILNIIQNGN